MGRGQENESGSTLIGRAVSLKNWVEKAWVEPPCARKKEGKKEFRKKDGGFRKRHMRSERNPNRPIKGRWTVKEGKPHPSTPYK